MFTKVDRYIEFLYKNKLTQSQFLFLYCLYHKKYELLRKYKEMFPTPDNTIIGKEIFNDLIRKGFIIQLKKGTTVNDFKITDKFIKNFINKNEAVKELFDLYPAFYESGGIKYPLTLVDEEVLATTYYEKIGGDLQEHFEILKDISYGIDNGLIKGKIEIFIKSKQWINIRKLREADIRQEEKNNNGESGKFESEFG